MRGAEEQKGRSIGVVETGGPPKPGEDRPSSTWLILARLDDISAQVTDVRGQVTEVRGQVAEVRGQVAEVRGQMAEVRGQVAELRTSTDARFNSMDRRLESLDRRWTWSLGLMAMMTLGLLAKLLLPGA